MKVFLYSLGTLLTILVGAAAVAEQFGLFGSGTAEPRAPNRTATAARAHDLSKTPRTVGEQPAYASKEPKYCLLVFGPKADTRVWLVLDLAYDPLREKPGKADALYADLNGDGHLTGPRERIPATVVSKKYQFELFSEFPNAESEQHLPRFIVGDVKSRDGTAVYKNLVVDVGWFIFGRKDREVLVAVDVPGYGRQQVGGEQLWFADSPAKAPIIWFGGALTLRLAPSGLLNLPVDYSGKEPAPPHYEEFPLVRGKVMPLRVEVGTAGIGLGTFVAISNDKAPADVHPIAKAVFSHADPKRTAIEVVVDLDKRCCGTLFNGSVAVPAEVALGKAKVTLSFPGWREGHVGPSVAEVEVSDKDVRPKVFRD